MNTPHSITLGLALLALALSCWSCNGSQLGAGEPLSLSPLTEGSSSAIFGEQLSIARSEAQWRELWQAHTRTQLPTPEPPAVDFDQDMVIAVFLGERSSAGYGVAIDACSVQAETVTVIAHEQIPPADSAQAAMLTAPFAMVKVPQAAGTGVLELTTRP